MKKRSQAITYLGKETEFEGKLTFHGTTRIEGHFKGEIAADGDLHVNEEAMVEANIHASDIVIHGEIHGNITADHKVEIHAPAKVFGNIHAPSVIMEEGVVFEGMTRMHQKDEVRIKKSADPGLDENPEAFSYTLTSIFGIVTDQDTGGPIKNAEVTCKGLGKKYAKTSVSGYYELADLKDGSWQVKIRAEGYKKEKAQIEILGEQKHEHNFELTPKNKKNA